MTYFQDASGVITLKPNRGLSDGLRQSQLGAIYSIGAHYSQRDDPTLVVLPTGAGKTAVLMMTPYLLGAERTLVITPSRFVRDQIASDFKALKTLKHLAVLPSDYAPPTVVENKGMVGTTAQWEAFRSADVVVSTPNAASPALEKVPSPPADLFDLVLVDEAHHSPAPTWNALIKAFPKAKVVLFTATPFRRDRKEIKAKYIYTYPIQRAFDDGIYGEMTYIPIMPSGSESTDEAIAISTSQIFEEDKAKGFEHSVLIRADSRSRASELLQIYKKAGNLRLEVVHSGHSKRTVDKAVESLREGKLDGVICVDMLGEGFDLPKLKIAALHAPHRSLAVTLQFVGRFARVEGTKLGEAKFLAAPSEMEGDLAELFAESEAWGRKVRLMGQETIEKEVRIKEFIEDFEPETVTANELTENDTSLYSFVVFNHVKVFDVFGSIDLHGEISIRGFQTQRVWVNQEESTIVALLREVVRPKWATTPGFDRIEHHLLVMYWDDGAKLLFVSSTLRDEPFYKDVVNCVISGDYKTLSLNKTNRVLRPFSQLELFNLGIRNRATGTVAESYRQMVGSSADHALDKSDAALYHRGHIFGRGTTPRGVDTIGVSSMGKVWRLEPTRIPELVEWCKRLAREIENSAPFTTGISIDHFDAGEDIVALPEVDLLAVDWSEELYKHPLMVMVAESDSSEDAISLLDLELTPIGVSEDRKKIRFLVHNGSYRSEWIYGVDPVPRLEYADEAQPRLWTMRNFKKKDAANYVGEQGVFFYLVDGSMIKGAELFRPMGDDTVLFDVNVAAARIDWGSEGVDIEKEYGDCAPRRSIHDWLEERLLATDAEVIVYDHRPGECSDFVTIKPDVKGWAEVELYHCKASGGAKSGDRTADIYEVNGQAIKSAKFRNRRQLLKHLQDRLNGGSRLVKGTRERLIDLLSADPRYEIQPQIHIVQPGISAESLSPKIGTLLASVNRGLVSIGCPNLKILCSK